MKKKSVTTIIFRYYGLFGCDYSKPEKRSGFFYNTFVDPMKKCIGLVGK